jgi:hypothetical protein
MPDENTQPAVQNALTPPVVNTPTQQKNVEPIESTYSREEIIAAAKTFETTPHLVAGALHETEKTEFTRAEAEVLIEAYKKKEV